MLEPPMIARELGGGEKKKKKKKKKKEKKEKFTKFTNFISRET